MKKGTAVPGVPTASIGQIIDLVSAVIHGIPDLSKEQAQHHIGAKGYLQTWLRLGLRYDLKKVDLERIEEILKESQPLRFSPEAREKIKAANYSIVEVPEGITLHRLKASGRVFGLTTRDFNNLRGGLFEALPTQARELAYNRSDLWDIPNTLLRTFDQQEFAISYHSDNVIKMRFGKDVKVIIPSAEEICCVAADDPEVWFYKLNDLPYYYSSRVLNSYGKNRLVVSRQSGGLSLTTKLKNDDKDLLLGIIEFLAPV